MNILYWQVNLNKILALCKKTPYEEERTGFLLIDLRHLREIFQILQKKTGSSQFQLFCCNYEWLPQFNNTHISQYGCDLNIYLLYAMQFIGQTFLCAKNNYGLLRSPNLPTKITVQSCKAFRAAKYSMPSRKSTTFCQAQ